MTVEFGMMVVISICSLTSFSIGLYLYVDRLRLAQKKASAYGSDGINPTFASSTSVDDAPSDFAALLTIEELDAFRKASQAMVVSPQAGWREMVTEYQPTPAAKAAHGL